MSKPPIVVVDADAIIAQTNPQDIHHQKATTISKNLIDKNAIVFDNFYTKKGFTLAGDLK
jgi:hypothetical protein